MKQAHADWHAMPKHCSPYHHPPRPMLLSGKKKTRVQIELDDPQQVQKPRDVPPVLTAARAMYQKLPRTMTQRQRKRDGQDVNVTPRTCDVTMTAVHNRWIGTSHGTVGARHQHRWLLEVNRANRPPDGGWGTTRDGQGRRCDTDGQHNTSTDRDKEPRRSPSEHAISPLFVRYETPMNIA